VPPLPALSLGRGRGEAAGEGRSGRQERGKRLSTYPCDRKLYRVVEDAFADAHEMIRVIDESEEDYLYPESYFVRVLRKIA
jgi:hypothetical protein